MGRELLFWLRQGQAEDFVLPSFCPSFCPCSLCPAHLLPPAYFSEHLRYFSAGTCFTHSPIHHSCTQCPPGLEDMETKMPSPCLCSKGTISLLTCFFLAQSASDTWLMCATVDCSGVMLLSYFSTQMHSQGRCTSELGHGASLCGDAIKTS